MTKIPKFKPPKTAHRNPGRKVRINGGSATKAIWNRLGDETDAAFHAFLKFRDMDAEIRSLEELFENNPEIDPSKVEDWRIKNRWAERILAWDRTTRTRKLWQQKKSVDEMKDRHARVASGMIGVAAKEAHIISQYMPDISEMNPETFGHMVRSIATLVEVGSRLERLSRDMPSDIVESRDVPMDLSNLSPEQLKQLKDMKKALRENKKT